MEHTRHGFWIADAGGVPAAAPALEGEIDADVVILGGGYTGMWAAWHLRRLDPGCRIVLLEAEVCGTGPSGRNGGFVNEMWFSLATMRTRFGDERAIELARAASESVRRIGAWCEEQGVDAHFTRGGYLQASASPAQDGVWDAALAACRDLGEGGAGVEMNAAAVRERCDSPVFRGGAYYPGAATAHPARLAFGLRRALLDAGVEIHENSPASLGRSGRGGPVVARTAAGKVTAAAAVLAIGSAVAGVRGLRRRLTVTSSHMVATEPVPDVIEELGWTGGEAITDSRAMIHYFRTTVDGRIAFGWGGGRIVRGARLGGRAEVDPGIAGQVHSHLLRFFPSLEGRRIEHAWGGPIDASPSHLPIVTTIRGGSVHAAYGYTGNGVGPSQLTGRCLASVALGRDDWAANLAIVDPHPVRLPPEPFRQLGGAAIRAAILRRERLEEEGRRAGPVTRAITRIPERMGVHIGR